MKKKKLGRYQCYKCSNRYNSWQARNHHAEIAHPPVLPPKKKHVNYADLARNSYLSWGQNMTDEEKKHPQIDWLKLGAIFVICEKLDALLEELKRTRTIR